LTGVGGQATAEWVQAVALARRIETHVLVALQQGVTGLARCEDNGRGPWCRE
jgi:hypothetical protein